MALTLSRRPCRSGTFCRERSTAGIVGLSINSSRTLENSTWPPDAPPREPRKLSEEGHKPDFASDA